MSRTATSKSLALPGSGKFLRRDVLPDAGPVLMVSPDRIWLQTEHAIAFAHDPARDGHMLVVPRKHVGTVYELRFEDACSPA